MRLFNNLVAAVLWFLPSWSAAEMAARIESVEGVVAIHKQGGRFSLAAVGTELGAKDIVATFRNSTALLVFTDQSQIAMRPESRLAVSDYVYNKSEPDKDRMVVRLLKGGVRTITGLIGKRGTEGAFHLAAAGATMGVGAVDFIARLCESDCVSEQTGRDRSQRAVLSASGTVGKVTHLSGIVTATSGGAARALALNGPIFESDVLESGDSATATVTMSDGSQLVLKKKSKVVVAAFRFELQRAEQNSAKLEMSRGAASYTSGAMSKVTPQAVRFRVHVSQIGIRGTAFNVACTEAGAHASESGAEADTTECDKAFYVNVREGKVAVRTGDNEREFSRGQSAYVARPGVPAVLLASTPTFISETSPASKPQTAPSEPGSPSGPAAQPQTAPSEPGSPSGPAAQPIRDGLFVASNEGSLVLRQGQEEIVVQRGESAFAFGSAALGPPVKLLVSPAFVDADPFLAPVRFLDASCFD